jgi:hypothetical protein
VSWSGKTHGPAALVIGLALIAAPGCGINRRYANDTIRQLPHAEVAIQYTTDESSVRPAGADVAPGGGSVSDVTAGKQTLSIVYPHPNPKLGRTCAEVTVRNGSGADSAVAERPRGRLASKLLRKKDRSAGAGNSPDDGVIRTALRRDELEFLVRDLVSDGFFEREQRSGDVHLQVTLGSRSTQKTWDRVAAFDRLIERVQTARPQQRRFAAGPAPTAPPPLTELLPPIPAIDDDLRPASHEELTPVNDPVKF